MRAPPAGRIRNEQRKMLFFQRRLHICTDSKSKSDISTRISPRTHKHVSSGRGMKGGIQIPLGGPPPPPPPPPPPCKRLLAVLLLCPLSSSKRFADEGSLMTLHNQLSQMELPPATLMVPFLPLTLNSEQLTVCFPADSHCPPCVCLSNMSPFFLFLFSTAHIPGHPQPHRPRVHSGARDL